MEKRGRPRKDSKENALEGNPGNRKSPALGDNSDVSTGTLFIPRELSAKERLHWRAVVTAFPSWYFTQADIHLLTCYCQQMYIAARARLALTSRPLIETRSNGSTCPHPAIKILASATAEIRHLSDSLCITRQRRRGLARQPDEMPLPDLEKDGDDPDEFGALIPFRGQGPKR